MAGAGKKGEGSVEGAKVEASVSAPEGVEPLADPGDGIAANRVTEFVDVAAVPVIPVGFSPVDIVERRRLFWVEASGEAELLAAAQKLSERASNVPKELGDMAPDVRSLSGLVKRAEGLKATVGALKSLLEAHTQMQEIALSDLHTMVTAAFAE